MVSVCFHFVALYHDELLQPWGASGQRRSPFTTHVLSKRPVFWNSAFFFFRNRPIARRQECAVNKVNGQRKIAVLARSCKPRLLPLPRSLQAGQASWIRSMRAYLRNNSEQGPQLNLNNPNRSKQQWNATPQNRKSHRICVIVVVVVRPKESAPTQEDPVYIWMPMNYHIEHLDTHKQSHNNVNIIYIYTYIYIYIHIVYLEYSQ